MKRTIFCVPLILCMAIMAGCAAQASGKTQTPISAKTELTSAQKTDDTAEVVTALLPSQTVEENSKTEDSANAPRPVERAETSENADNAAEKQPTTAETAPPTTPEQVAIPTPAPEDKPAPAPTLAPTQKPAKKQEEEPAPAPKPEPELKPEPADRWAAVDAANAYAAAQYGVITDGSLTLDNSAYRFPASVAADASQEVLEAKARDMVDYTFRQLMMQAGMDSIADAGFHCNVCIVEDGASLLIYVLYDG